jgi:predicted enzyme related to lactoylglutathione lyase
MNEPTKPDDTPQGNAPTNRFSFTKVLVKDLDKLAMFFKSVFNMHEVQRVKADAGAGIGRIEEIMLSISGNMMLEPPLVLFKTLDKPSPRESDSILGFTVFNIDEVLTRLESVGGKVLGETADHPEAVARVAFAADPEGRLLEIVQLR